MEPDNLKPPSPEDASLDAWLRAGAPAPLADDGFSARLLAALPPAAPAARPARRLLAAGAGAVAGLLAAALPLAREVASNGGEDGLLAWVNLLGQPAVGLALGAAVVSLAVVFWRELRPFLPRLR